KTYLLIFLISMVPLIELRGAIPIGFGWMQALLNSEDSTAILPPQYIISIYCFCRCKRSAHITY
ncbi:MAG: hypothetical protein J6X43_00370, partial [Bacteroidales bacterium]|nr:hypothetical protein [Bacteroidales bacterium]